MLELEARIRVVEVFALGERGLAHPLARLRKWEADPSAWIIAGMEKLGLARNVIRISPERQAQKAAS